MHAKATWEKLHDKMKYHGKISSHREKALTHLEIKVNFIEYSRNLKSSFCITKFSRGDKNKYEHTSNIYIISTSNHNYY